MWFFTPFFGDIITTWNASKSNREDISVYTVKEFIHEPLTDESGSTEGALSSISNEKGMEFAQLTKATGSFVSLKSPSYNIKQGNTKAFNVPVGSGVTLLDIDLNWGNSKNSLVLTSYPPGSSSHTFNDDSSGGKDGRIVLRIKPQSGKYLKQGDWKFTVKGKAVNGTEDYTFNAVAHVPH
jgi:hypothetical protein